MRIQNVYIMGKRKTQYRKKSVYQEISKLYGYLFINEL